MNPGWASTRPIHDCTASGNVYPASPDTCTYAYTAMSATE